jgi:hypothetical protein
MSRQTDTGGRYMAYTCRMLSHVWLQKNGRGSKGSVLWTQEHGASMISALYVTHDGRARHTYAYASMAVKAKQCSARPAQN